VTEAIGNATAMRVHSLKQKRKDASVDIGLQFFKDKNGKQSLSGGFFANNGTSPFSVADGLTIW
jgi:hypothetical protein